MGESESVTSAPTAPWHEGERAMQAIVGVRDRMEAVGKVVLRDHMPEQHRQFFSERDQLFVATTGPDGQPWATLVEGDVGFVASPSPRQLTVAAALPTGDPGAAGFQDGAPVGLIGVEFDTRRRNRMNGVLRVPSQDDRFAIDVVQSFGNCAKYIQARTVVPDARSFASVKPAPPVGAAKLNDGAITLIRSADTFFIASRSAAPSVGREEGLDMSHRGGPPGFVQVHSRRKLSFPDYRGNFFFNTLGNLQADPRCSLLFLDFATGNTLQIAGEGQLVTDPARYSHWAGAERAIEVDVREVVFTEARSRWRFIGCAPQFA